MSIKFNKPFYGALFIFRHFNHLKTLIFTNSLNHEICSFLAAKRPVDHWQGLFCFVFFRPALYFRSYYKAIEKKDKRGRTLYTLFYYCIKYICSIRVAYRCFVKFQVYLIFALETFQVYSLKYTQNGTIAWHNFEWHNSLNFFVWKFEIL